MKHFGKLSAATLLLMGAPLAQAKNPVTSTIEDMNFNFDYKVKYSSITQDLEVKENTDTVNEVNYAKLSLAYFYVNFDGKFGSDYDYKFSWNAGADDLASGFEVGMVYRNLGNIFLGLGKNKVANGGWDLYDIGHSPLDTEYTQNHLVFGDQPVMEVGMKLTGGHVKLQLTNDVEVVGTTTTDATTGLDTVGAPYTGNYSFESHSEGKPSQPAIAIEYMGDFGGIKPLAQIVSYDKGKSTYFGLGVKAEMGALTAVLDFINDTRSERRLSTVDAKHKGFSHTYTSIDLMVAYNVGPVTPFLEYATFDHKQPTDEGGKDLDVNSNGTFDDNASEFAVGVTVNALGKHFKPTLVYRSKTGDFTNPKDGKTHSRSQSTVEMQWSGAI